MTVSDATTLLRLLLAEFATPPVFDDSPLDLDSLTVVLLVEALEDRHSIPIPTREVHPEAFASLASLAALLARLTDGSENADAPNRDLGGAAGEAS